ncbi:MAG: hypothetical protein M3Z04_08950 [Chloroflexota bacterium]|nr:hypothetical protein [Chloroflexota bacterium]
MNLSTALPPLFDHSYRAPNVVSEQISRIGLDRCVLRQIVTLHGGTIAVTRSEEQASIFTVWVPLAAL